MRDVCRGGLGVHRAGGAGGVYRAGPARGSPSRRRAEGVNGLFGGGSSGLPASCRRPSHRGHRRLARSPTFLMSRTTRSTGRRGSELTRRDDVRYIAVLVVVCLLASPSSASAQQGECGGHRIEWLGGVPNRFNRLRQHGPPVLPMPPEMTTADRVLWDALVFDAYDHPTADPSAQDAQSASLPLDKRHTRVMGTGHATSFGVCIQSSDETYTGSRLERYANPDWWREQVQRFANLRWDGAIQVDTCTGDPPTGWVYVREGKRGEVRDDFLAHARTWYYLDPHGIAGTWVKSEIVWHSATDVRNTDEEWFESTLAHELGHVLGFWHVPPSSGFVMLADGASRTWPDQERWLAQWAYAVGPSMLYPGFATPVPALPLVGLVLLAAMLWATVWRRGWR